MTQKKKERYLNNLIKNGLKIGRNVSIVSDFFFDPSHCYLISIGDNCTICPNVRLIAHDASTKKSLGFTKVGKVIIEENCFIGDSTIILLGVKIGRNSIIGTGSIVTKDIPAYSVAAGNPAKIVCSLDEYLQKIREISAHKKIFGEEYKIDVLTEEKRAELIESIAESIGFMN